MIDLFKLVTRYYYSPLTKGSNSIKDVLPAIIYESSFLKDKYGKRVKTVITIARSAMFFKIFMLKKLRD